MSGTLMRKLAEGAAATDEWLPLKYGLTGAALGGGIGALMTGGKSMGGVAAGAAGGGTLATALGVLAMAAKEDSTGAVTDYGKRGKGWLEWHFGPSNLGGATVSGVAGGLAGKLSQVLYPIRPRLAGQPLPGVWGRAGLGIRTHAGKVGAGVGVLLWTIASEISRKRQLNEAVAKLGPAPTQT